MEQCLSSSLCDSVQLLLIDHYPLILVIFFLFLFSCTSILSLNGITSDDRLKMPQVTLFGVELTWGLRDSVEYAGNYDEIYEKNFGGNYTEETRGRNAVNQGGPLMLSRPGLQD